MKSLAQAVIVLAVVAVVVALAIKLGIIVLPVTGPIGLMKISAILLLLGINLELLELLKK